MGTGKNCPNCDADIGIWPVFKASHPEKIRCPHCGIRLKYGDTRLLVLAFRLILIAYVAGCAALLFGYIPLGRPALRLSALAVMLILFVVLWLPAELLVTMYLRNHKTLTRADAVGANADPSAGE